MVNMMVEILVLELEMLMNGIVNMCILFNLVDEVIVMVVCWINLESLVIKI